MRCHYEVLEVARDADEAAIKKAYRKAALAWHPDKCKLPEAEERFREVQAAYEILSVPNERAWYDGHRESILRDDDGGNGAGSAPDDEFSLFAYFRTSAFSGFGAGGGSFYGVYGDVFSRLAQQEARAAAAAGRAYTPPPPFGGPDTPYAPAVAAFYEAWLSFSTLKDFAWCDEHNPAQAPGRKIRRLMEEENRRARRAAQREHNDGVRQLAAFCRARDPRVREHARAAEAEAARRAAEAAARRAADKADKAAKAAAFREAAWAAAEPDPEWLLEELDALAAAREQGPGGGSAAGGEDGEGGDGLYCPVCRKKFRSEAQWANHERSRKHLDALAALRAQLQDEERRAGGADGSDAGADGGGGGSSGDDADAAGGGGGARGATRAARKKAAKAAKRLGRAQARAPDSDEDTSGEGDGVKVASENAGKLAEELASKARVASPEAAASDDADDGGDDADLLRFAARRGAADAGGGDDSGSGSESDGSGNGDAAEAPPAPPDVPAPAAAAAGVKKSRRANKGAKGAAAEAEAPAAPPRPLGKRGLKAAARRAGAGAAKAAPPPAAESATACSLCGAEHESRSALFRHLRAAHSLRS